MRLPCLAATAAMMFFGGLVSAQITSIPPITDVPTYGTPAAGRPAPWRRGGGLFGRRATPPPVAAPGGVVYATPPVSVQPGAACSSPPIALPPGCTYGVPAAAPASGGWQPVGPPASAAPASPVPATPSSGMSAPSLPPGTVIPSGGTLPSSPPGGYSPGGTSGVTAQRVILYYAPPSVPPPVAPTTWYPTTWTGR